ncbi:uncharacterized protein LOC126736089 [Anthonomus grandis grandis]|uniref:uncharacterized protein LOC126736089 n=1 Tax=Anthonomus grandis grandis TaxID=2921223 RepID=UPI002165DAD4|nr:uncharacterized protein LOC126736089 [Anthonomus grandis grandis]
MEIQDFLKEVLYQYQQKQYRKILNLNENSDNRIASKILWVWPSLKNLNFIKGELRRYGVKGVISIGCGCGLLEWIIQEHTGLPVIGYEINREWWESKYSVPPFINLRYADDEIQPKFDPEFAMMFCYFNDGTTFRNYLQKYSGKIVLIIGPADGAGRHTAPEPFYPDFRTKNWRLISNQEVKDTKDFIAIYMKTK